MVLFSLVFLFPFLFLHGTIEGMYGRPCHGYYIPWCLFFRKFFLFSMNKKKILSIE
jgi:hypothetical protein